MDAATGFRALLAAKLALLASVAVYPFMVEREGDLGSTGAPSVPAPMFQTWFESLPSVIVQLAVAFFFMAVSVGYFASIYGLFNYKRWGRSVYAFCAVVGVAIYPLVWAPAADPWSDLQEWLIAAITGSVLALSYVGPVAEKIANRAPNNALERARDP